MIKIKDVARLKEFGYKQILKDVSPVIAPQPYFYKHLESDLFDESVDIWVSGTGVITVIGNAIEELLEEGSKLESAGLLVGVSNDEKD